MEKNDKQLIIDYLKGDEQAFSTLVNRYLKSIYNFIYRLIGSLEEAEDLTQKTFFQAWKNIKKFQLDLNFKVWIFSIARNVAIDWLRKKKAIVFSDFEDETGQNLLIEKLIDSNPLPDQIFIEKENQKKLSKVLKKIILAPK